MTIIGCCGRFWQPPGAQNLQNGPEPGIWIALIRPVMWKSWKTKSLFLTLAGAFVFAGCSPFKAMDTGEKVFPHTTDNEKFETVNLDDYKKSEPPTYVSTDSAVSSRFQKLQELVTSLDDIKFAKSIQSVEFTALDANKKTIFEMRSLDEVSYFKVKVTFKKQGAETPEFLLDVEKLQADEYPPVYFRSDDNKNIQYGVTGKCSAPCRYVEFYISKFEKQLDGSFKSVAQVPGQHTQTLAFANTRRARVKPNDPEPVVSSLTEREVDKPVLQETTAVALGPSKTRVTIPIEDGKRLVVDTPRHSNQDTTTDEEEIPEPITVGLIGKAKLETKTTDSEEITSKELGDAKIDYTDPLSRTEDINAQTVDAPIDPTTFLVDVKDDEGKDSETIQIRTTPKVVETPEVPEEELSLKERMKRFFAETDSAIENLKYLVDLMNKPVVENPEIEERGDSDNGETPDGESEEEKTTADQSTPEEEKEVETVDSFIEQLFADNPESEAIEHYANLKDYQDPRFPGHSLVKAYIDSILKEDRNYKLCQDSYRKNRNGDMVKDGLDLNLRAFDCVRGVKSGSECQGIARNHGFRKSVENHLNNVAALNPYVTDIFKALDVSPTMTNIMFVESAFTKGAGVPGENYLEVNPTSSAGGPYQVIDKTARSTVNKLIKNFGDVYPTDEVNISNARGRSLSAGDDRKYFYSATWISAGLFKELNHLTGNRPDYFYQVYHDGSSTGLGGIYCGHDAKHIADKARRDQRIANCLSMMSGKVRNSPFKATAENYCRETESHPNTCIQRHLDAMPRVWLESRLLGCRKLSLQENPDSARIRRCFARLGDAFSIFDPTKDFGDGLNAVVLRNTHKTCQVLRGTLQYISTSLIQVDPTKYEVDITPNPNVSADTVPIYNPNW